MYKKRERKILNIAPVLPGLLVNRLVGRSSLLALSILVVELGLAVDSSSKHSDGHTSSVKQVDGHIEEEDTEGDGQALLEVTTDSHGQGTGKLVGVERRDVEKQGEETVTEERGESGREGNLSGGDKLVEAADFTGGSGASQSLEGGKRRHAEEELNGRKRQRASHESVGNNSLHTNDSENGEKETGVSEAHLTESSHGSTDDEGKERKVGHVAVGTAVVDTVDENGEDRAQHAHGLVEGNGDHGQRQVGNSDVGSEESAESDEREVLTTSQSREFEVAHLHHGIGSHTGERGVEESQEPWEVEL
ncbi:hypothetical protein HG531_012716 [Fusarium graminearum]|nr:hypothetical protein HG531_012716 [Fusarium graminearum]